MSSQPLDNTTPVPVEGSIAMVGADVPMEEAVSEEVGVSTPALVGEEQDAWLSLENTPDLQSAVRWEFTLRRWAENAADAVVRIGLFFLLFVFAD